MVTVTTNVSSSLHNNLAAIMCDTMQTVLSITPRSKRDIIALLEADCIALAFDDEKLVGWLIATPYSPHVQELGMAYIRPEYRSKGIFSRMIKPLINRRPVSLAVTYETRLADLLTDRWGFAPSSLAQFTYSSRGLFIFNRLRSLSAIKAVASHVASSKPIYLIRDNYE